MILLPLPHWTAFTKPLLGGQAVIFPQGSKNHWLPSAKAGVVAGPGEDITPGPH